MELNCFTSSKPIPIVRILLVRFLIKWTSLNFTRSLVTLQDAGNLWNISINRRIKHELKYYTEKHSRSLAVCTGLSRVHTKTRPQLKSMLEKLADRQQLVRAMVQIPSGSKRVDNAWWEGRNRIITMIFHETLWIVGECTTWCKSLSTTKMFIWLL